MVVLVPEGEGRTGVAAILAVVTDVGQEVETGVVVSVSGQVGDVAVELDDRAAVLLGEVRNRIAALPGSG